MTQDAYLFGKATNCHSTPRGSTHVGWQVKILHGTHHWLEAAGCLGSLLALALSLPLEGWVPHLVGCIRPRVRQSIARHLPAFLLVVSGAGVGRCSGDAVVGRAGGGLCVK